MQAMVLDAPGAPLRAAKLPPPELGPGLLRLRAREPLRARALYGLPRRRRLRGGGRRRRALLLPAPGRLLRRAGSAAALRRADRLPLAALRRRRGATRALRLRRLGPHRRAGGTPSGTARLRVRPRRRRSGRLT